MITPEVLEQVAINVRNGKNYLHSIEVRVMDGSWRDESKSERFLSRGETYRIKPKTIIVNGREVPEPLKEIPQLGEQYWCVAPNHKRGVMSYIWADDELDNKLFKRNICHGERESTQIHTAALLGIDVEELRG